MYCRRSCLVSLLAAAFVVVALPTRAADTAEPVLVFAAVSLTNALDEIGTRPSLTYLKKVVREHA